MNFGQLFASAFAGFVLAMGIARWAASGGDWVAGLMAAAGLALFALVAVASYTESDEKDLDVWKPQQKLMTASNQDLPITPTVTRGTLLYYALTLEEMGEAAGTLRQIIARLREKHRPDLSDIYMSFKVFEVEMKEDAIKLREMIRQLPVDFNVPLQNGLAKYLFDDFEDIQVVVAGLGLSTGFPMREGYREVARSNLSKINPKTGIIDKDPTGKWIKGPNYRAPDLERVLKEHIARVGGY